MSLLLFCLSVRLRNHLTKELHAKTPCAGLGIPSAKTISTRSNAWHHQDGRDTGIKTRVKYFNSSITDKDIRHTTFAFKRAVTSSALEAIAGVVVAGWPYL